MTNLREAAQMALDALVQARRLRFALWRNGCDCEGGEHTCDPLKDPYAKQFNDAIIALEDARLAQPEPWVKTYSGGKPNYTEPCVRCGEVNPAEIHTCTPKQRGWQGAALNLALDALENTASRSASEQFVIEQHAIAFIKKSLDRVDPAPVAKNEEGRITWIVDDWPQNCFLYSEPPSWTPVEIGVDVTQEGTHVVGMYVLMPEAVRHVFYSKFHPAPPQREWVGLTDEEKSDIWYVVTNRYFVTEDTHVYADAIEAKLREKNA